MITTNLSGFAAIDTRDQFEIELNKHYNIHTAWLNSQAETKYKSLINLQKRFLQTLIKINNK